MAETAGSNPAEPTIPPRISFDELFYTRRQPLSTWRSFFAPEEEEGMVLEEGSVRRLLRYRWLIFAVLALGYFLVYFHRTSTSVVGGDIADIFEVSASSVAMLGSAYFFVYTALQFPSGVLADRWGPKRTLIVFLSLAAFGSFLSAFAPSFEVVLLGRLLISAGVAMVYIPAMRVFAMWFRSNEFASLTGILLAVGNVGAIVAATPLAVMTASYGWQNTYILLGLFTIALTVLVYAIVIDRPRLRGLPSIQEVETAERGSPPPGAGDEVIPLRQGMTMAFSSGRKFWPLAIWFFIIYGCIMTFQGLQAGMYYRNIYGMEDYSLLITLVGVGMICGAPVSGVLSDRVLRSRRKVLIMGTAIFTLLWGFMWLTAGDLATMGAQGAITFCFGFFGSWFVVAFAQLKELFPLAIIGTVIASLNIFPFAGAAVMQSVSGLFVTTGTELAEFKSLWLFMFLCMLVATLCAFLSVEKPPE